MTPPAAGAPGRPNVLWICADDFAPYVCGAYGDRRVRTPHLDRLAAQGVRFDRAYCSCPLSTPSRQAFLTGRYPRAVGVTLSPTPLPRSEATAGSLLRRAGYDTAALGKTHFYSPLLHEFDLCVDLDEHCAWLGEKGPAPLPEGVEVLGPWRPFRDPPEVWLNAACLPYGAVDADMSGAFFAAHAERFLARPRDRPFFLLVNYYEPHSPFRFPVEYRGRHDPAAFDVPRPGPEDAAGIPPVFRGLTHAHKQGVRAAYYTSVEHLDADVGRVLDALERSGRAGDTLVVFNSDHGYLLGHHGRFEKHCCYEEAVRAALLVRGPGVARPGRSTAALVELIDVLPTLLEWCGAEAPPNLHGRSLGPLLRGESEDHRGYVFVEYADNEEGMIRSGRWKLVYCTGRRRRRDGYALDGPLPGRSVRLYDLEADPGEFVNVAGRTEHAALVAGLLRLLADHVRRSSPRPRLLPAGGGVFAVLDAGLQPSELLLYPGTW
jgi:choline-sulfatase